MPNIANSATERLDFSSDWVKIPAVYWIVEARIARPSQATSTGASIQG
jgi:hypothetical protein